VDIRSRKLLNGLFSGFGFFSISLLAASLIIILTPIFVNGIGAFIFKGTIEFRKFNFEQFNRGEKEELFKEINKVSKSRMYIYNLISNFEKQIENEELPNSYKYEEDLREIKTYLHELMGPFPNESPPVMMRDRYGATRWEKAKEIRDRILFVEKWDYSIKESMGKKVLTPRINGFKGTTLEHLFPYLEKNLKKITEPKLTFYWNFFSDKSFDSHLFGGIGPELLGTLYLVLGTMIFAIPIGIISAIYLTEFAKPGKIINFINISIGTLAGVPSIVFGLFGLAFFIMTVKVSDSKSVLAGSLTLALLVLPTIIRASEEALKSVPKTYKEAALSLGAGEIFTIFRVILPAALPGILTGIVISMGRAAGETAPIIFTAAVSIGNPLKLFETLSQPTPALSWNIYNLVTEHESVESIRHVQYGMVFALVLLVLALNLTAIIMRAKISKKLRG